LFADQYELDDEEAPGGWHDSWPGFRHADRAHALGVRRQVSR
jgi:hypothetical protein